MRRFMSNHPLFAVADRGFVVVSAHTALPFHFGAFQSISHLNCSARICLKILAAK